MVSRILSSTDKALFRFADSYPELVAALFGWVVLSPVARWLARLIG